MTRTPLAPSRSRPHGGSSPGRTQYAHPLPGVRNTPLLITPPGERIQSHRGHDGHAVDDELIRLAQAGQEDKVAQDGDEQHAGDRAADTTPTAGEAGAADDDGGE